MKSFTMLVNNKIKYNIVDSDVSLFKLENTEHGNMMRTISKHFQYITVVYFLLILNNPLNNTITFLLEQVIFNEYLVSTITATTSLRIVKVGPGVVMMLLLSHVINYDLYLIQCFVPVAHFHEFETGIT